MALIEGVYDTYTKSQLAVNLIAAFKSIRMDEKYANITKPTVCEELSSAINHVFKANYEVKIDPTLRNNAYVYPPKIDKHSPLWRGDLKEYCGEYLDKDARKLAAKSTQPILDLFIDAKTGEYKGELAKVKIPMVISWDLAVGTKISPEGASGIIAHEIGHANWMFKSIAWTVRANVVLNQMHQVISGSESRDTKIEVVTKINKREKLPLADKVEWLVDANDEKSVATITIGALQHQQRDELGGAGFEARTFEALADHYATEQGLGNDLIIALSQLPGSSTWVKDSAARISAKVVEFMLWSTLTIATGGLAAIVPAMMVLTHDPESKIYDDPADRAGRIIRQQIASMSTRRGEVSKEELERLKAVQRIADMYSKSSDWVEYLNETLTPSGRNVKAQRQLQQALEVLAANPLFAKAAELETV